MVKQGASEASVLAYELWCKGIAITLAPGVERRLRLVPRMMLVGRGGGCGAGVKDALTPEGLERLRAAKAETIALLEEDSLALERACLRAAYNEIRAVWRRAFGGGGDVEEEPATRHEQDRIRAAHECVLSAIESADLSSYALAQEAWCAAATPFRWLPHGAWYAGQVCEGRQREIYARECAERRRAPCQNGECGGACGGRRVEVGDGPG